MRVCGGTVILDCLVSESMLSNEDVRWYSHLGLSCIREYAEQ